MAERPRRRRRLATALVALAVLVGGTAAMVSVIHVGVLHGLALAGAGLVVYAVPATLLGWPGPTLANVAALVTDLVGAIVDGVVSCLRALSD